MIFCVSVCLQSLEVLLRHPEDNRNQIRELAQTLMDGGVLDELIQQKLDAFNTRWDELMARVRHTVHSLTQVQHVHTEVDVYCTAELDITD